MSTPSTSANNNYRPTSNSTARNNGVPNPVSCSFRGDMQVKTPNGYIPIEQVQIGDMVWSRNQITGLMSFNKVLQTMNSIDPDTTYVTITDAKGNNQTIVSDSLHLYFAQYGNDLTPAKPSLEKDYLGNIQNAYWINASDLEVGYRVLDDDGDWQTITKVVVEQVPLDSYNLEVNTDHTFFIRGLGGLDGIWVHNKDCWTSIPSDAQTSRVGNQTVYTFENRGRNVQVINNPDWTPNGTEKKYVEVSVDNGRVNINNLDEPNIYRSENTQARDDRGFTSDPLHPSYSSGFNCFTKFISTVSSA